MTDLREFGVEFAARVRAPDLVELAAVAQRRRAARFATVAGVAVAALVVALVASAVQSDRAPDPPAKTPNTPVRSGPWSWTADQIIGSPTSVDTYEADDGVDARVVGSERCDSTCGQAYEYTAPGGRRLRFALGGASRDIPRYLGHGVFYLPGCLRCSQVNTSLLLSPGAAQPVRLRIWGSAPEPRPGLRIVSCGTIPAPCVLDVTAPSLAPLDREVLPAWVQQVLDRVPGAAEELGVDDLGHGLAFLAHGIGLGLDGARTPPLLISGGVIRDVTTERGSAPPDPGTNWVDALPSTLFRGCPCLLDVAAATLTPIALPDGVDSWAHSTQGGFWGITGVSTARWIGADGALRSHDLGVLEATHWTQLADGGTHGEMAFYVVPSGDPGQPGARLIISTDRGKSWQVRTAPASARSDVEAARLAKDWQTWPKAR